MKVKLKLDIEPRPQSRPRFASRGKYVSVYEDNDMKKWRNKCSGLIAEEYLLKPALEGALRVHAVFFIQAPKYITKVKKNHDRLLKESIFVDKKPDIDNYEKALYDSMSGLIFKDDGQIACHTIEKRYSLNPRIEVEIEEIDE